MNSAETKQTLEDKVKEIFAGSIAGSGEEELLRLASRFSLQFHSRQIRVMLYLSDLALRCDSRGRPLMAKRIRNFLDFYRELKQYNNSDVFVMAALESISLKRFISDNAIRVNVEK